MLNYLHGSNLQNKKIKDVYEWLNMEIFISVRKSIENIFKKVYIDFDYELSILFYEKKVETDSTYAISWFEFVSTNNDLSIESQLFEKSFSVDLGDLRDYWNFLYRYMSGKYDYPIIDILKNKFTTDEYVVSVSCPVPRKTHQPNNSVNSYFEGSFIVILRFKRSQNLDFLKMKYSLPYENSSFLDAVMIAYPEEYNSRSINYDALYTSASRIFINSLTMILMENPENAGNSGYDNLLTKIDRLSALAYEKADAVGNILFCDLDTINAFSGRFSLLFKTPYLFNNHKMIRKLLQIVSEDLYLVATPSKVYGAVTHDVFHEIQRYSAKRFEVHIKKNRIWTVCYNGVELMRSEYNNIYFSKSHINYPIVINALTNVLNIDDTDKLITIITSAALQTHGTIIVFSRDAASEAQRLKNTSIAIEKRDLSIKTEQDVEFIKFITSIDGAILCDETGCCYSIGVILDGITDQSEESAEDISRGARYNSAHRYYWQRKNCVIVIISEDGDVSIIPNNSAPDIGKL